MIRLKYDLVVLGKEHVSDQHPSLIVANHKRHLDSIILISTLFLLRGPRRPNQRLCFALNEVWFSAETLARFLGWGWPWNAVVSHVSLAPHLRFLNAHPISRFIDRRRLSRIHQQLACFATLLDSGYDVLWTPEGGLMKDGTVHPPRAGLHRLVGQTHASLRLVPVAISYDSMTTGRQRAFVQLGAEMAVDHDTPRLSFDAQTQAAIVRSLTVHMGHLAAALLTAWAQNCARSAEELSEWLQSYAARLCNYGCPMDPRLTSRWSFQRRLRRFLAYAARNGIVINTGDRWAPNLGMAHPAMRYAFNELEQIENAWRVVRS